MKRRITAATLAAATALSLTVAPAASAYELADPGFHKDSSSQVNDTEVVAYIIRMIGREAFLKEKEFQVPSTDPQMLASSTLVSKLPRKTSAASR